MTSVVGLFEKANKVLPEEKPLLPKLHDMLTDLLKRLMTRFIKPSVIACQSLVSINVSDSSNQMDDSDLMIGSKAKQFLEENPKLSTETFFFGLSQV